MIIFSNQLEFNIKPELKLNKDSLNSLGNIDIQYRINLETFFFSGIDFWI